MNADTLTGQDAAPGRVCPLHYRYAPEVFRREPDGALAGLDALWVVGGLYGHVGALAALERLLAREQGRCAVVFNGDFHWFDAEPARFAEVQRRVLGHVALRGNVETELARAPADGGDDDAADSGCGCAYPEWVGDGVVERSNRILARLRRVTTPAQRAELAALPMHAVAEVGGRRVALVHGDAESLAGWGFAQEHLRDAAHRVRVAGWFERAGVEAFASSHTCLPVFQAWPGAQGGRWVFNNGAAGMPNFAGDAAGLATRIARTPWPGPERRVGTAWGGLHAEALALIGSADEQREWRAWFARCWPAGSDAEASYGERIARGPDYTVESVIRPADAG